MKNLRWIAVIVFALAVFGASPAFAQDGDVLRELVPPPKLLLRYQDELQLTEEQKNRLKEVIKEAHSRSLDLEFEVQEESNKLARLLEGNSIDVKKAVAQADKLLQVESELKKVRLEMLIKTKNLLTTQQLTKIEAFREKRREDRRRRRRNR